MSCQTITGNTIDPFEESDRRKTARICSHTRFSDHFSATVNVTLQSRVFIFTIVGRALENDEHSEARLFRNVTLFQNLDCNEVVTVQ